MPRAHKSRSGSLQYWPRKRAQKETARVRSWPKVNKTVLLGFPAYKVGMTHAQVQINNPHSRLKNDLFSIPVTILECPSIKPFSLRFYKKTPYGLQAVSEILNKNFDKDLTRRLRLPKKQITSEIPKDYDEVRLICSTQPKITSIGKKKPEVLELGIGGPLESKAEYGKSWFDKEVKVVDVFKNNQLIDVHGVTKGKGFQGTIKRFGLSLKAKKSEKKKRSTGNLGAVTPSKVLYTVPQAGKMGYHLRTEVNKQILKIEPYSKETIPEYGFRHYGLVKNTYLILKGSVSGPRKRLLTLTQPMRNKKVYTYEIKRIVL